MARVVCILTLSCYLLQDLLQELVDGGVQKSVRDECGLILLPKQLWCSIKERTDDETWSEVGWLFDHGHAITSRCIFAAGKLKASLYIVFVSISI